ncbi:MAG: UDP-N-acetylmuramoyl-L-alanine--D-glutamate ligase [bacterium]
MRRPPRYEELRGMRVLVVGLGRAGTAATRFLLRAGARVAAVEDDPARRRRAPAVAGVRARVVDLRVVMPGAFGLAVVSPGVADASAPVRRLRAAGIPVVDELDLAAAFVKGRLFAVTGTNGKSTTAALIAAMLEAAGRSVFVGGNIAPGRPLSAAIAGPARDSCVVEASSFQLERARWFRPDVALLLNVTPDHLNRHRDIGSYARCKYRILRLQRPADRAVLNLDDPLVVAAAGVRSTASRGSAAAGTGRAGREFFSLTARAADARIARGWLVAHGRRVIRAREVRLPGRHNLANALAACCAVLPEGVAPATAARVLRSFRGLPHRLEFVRRLRGVTYVNNSMCTNPAAGIHSLGAFERGVVLITGGREKGLPKGDYLSAVARRARHVVLAGENAAELAAGLAALGAVSHEVQLRLTDAVRAAGARARPGDTVLYSPAFASFDQFRDFQARGRAFRREVARLR